MKIDLSLEEVTILKEALNCSISELGMEISSTDLKDFRDPLKRRKSILMGLVDRLENMAA